MSGAEKALTTSRMNTAYRQQGSSEPKKDLAGRRPRAAEPEHVLPVSEHGTYTGGWTTVTLCTTSLHKVYKVLSKKYIGCLFP